MITFFNEFPCVHRGFQVQLIQILATDEAGSHIIYIYKYIEYIIYIYINRNCDLSFFFAKCKLQTIKDCFSEPQKVSSEYVCSDFTTKKKM